ncbi:MAG TPA: 2-dehydropantoate 2-reductase [Niallia sp.]|nr:2-dehydropantoate 2-reductase [Niallia sp.]
MNIGIIGAGAIGLVSAYYLNKNHHVTLYVRSENQLQAILENGIHYIYKQELKGEKVTVKLFNEWKGEEDLTVIAVKQYQLVAVLEKIEEQTNKIGTTLFLQNGMSHIHMLKESSLRDILIGIVEHGAIKENEHTVIHSGIGSIKLAVLKGSCKDTLTQLTDKQLSSFQMFHEPNYFTIMQKKLFVNSIINTLTSILKVRNGQLVENEHYISLMNLFMEEIFQVLALNDEEKVVYKQYCIQLIHQTKRNKSSMLRDLEEFRKTEIDAILGYIIDEAEKKKVAIPITTSYYYMIKGQEQMMVRSEHI